MSRGNAASLCCALWFLLLRLTLLPLVYAINIVVVVYSSQYRYAAYITTFSLTMTPFASDAFVSIACLAIQIKHKQKTNVCIFADMLEICWVLYTYQQLPNKYPICSFTFREFCMRLGAFLSLVSSLSTQLDCCLKRALWAHNTAIAKVSMVKQKKGQYTALIRTELGLFTVCMWLCVCVFLQIDRKPIRCTQWMVIDFYFIQLRRILDFGLRIEMMFKLLSSFCLHNKSWNIDDFCLLCA